MKCLIQPQCFGVRSIQGTAAQNGHCFRICQREKLHAFFAGLEFHFPDQGSQGEADPRDDHGPPFHTLQPVDAFLQCGELEQGMVFKTPAMRVRIQNGMAVWRACLARRVPGGTLKPTGASDARFGPNPCGPWFCGRCAALRTQANRPGLPWNSRLTPHPAKATPRTARVFNTIPRHPGQRSCVFSQNPPPEQSTGVSASLPPKPQAALYRC